MALRRRPPLSRWEGDDVIGDYDYKSMLDEASRKTNAAVVQAEQFRQERDDRARMLESSNAERRRIVGVFSEAIGAFVANGLDVVGILGPELEEQVHTIVESEQPAKGETREELRAARDAAKLAAGKVRGVLAAVLDALRCASNENDCQRICDGDGSGMCQCDYVSKGATRALALAEAALKDDPIPAEIRRTLYAACRTESGGTIEVDHRDTPRQIGGGQYHIEAYHLGDGLFLARWREGGEFSAWEFVRGEKGDDDE